MDRSTFTLIGAITGAIVGATLVVISNKMLRDIDVIVADLDDSKEKLTHQINRLSR